LIRDHTHNPGFSTIFVFGFVRPFCKSPGWLGRVDLCPFILRFALTIAGKSAKTGGIKGSLSYRNGCFPANCLSQCSVEKREKENYESSGCPPIARACSYASPG
jgi:hypothetical protein